MRLSVLAADAMLFFPAAFFFVRRCLCAFEVGSKGETVMLTNTIKMKRKLIAI